MYNLYIHSKGIFQLEYYSSNMEYSRKFPDPYICMLHTTVQFGKLPGMLLFYRWPRFSYIHGCFLLVGILGILHIYVFLIANKRTVNELLPKSTLKCRRKNLCSIERSFRKENGCSVQLQRPEFDVVVLRAEVSIEQELDIP